MAYTQQPGRGPMNKYAPLQEKGLIKPKPLKNKGDAAKKAAKRKKWKNRLAIAATVAFPVLGVLGAKKVRDDAYGL